MKSASRRGARTPGAAQRQPRPRKKSLSAAVHVATQTVRVVSETEARLADALARLERLSAAYDTAERELSEWEELEVERLGDATAELLRAQQVERRLERLEDDLRVPRERRGPERRGPRRAAGRAQRGSGAEAWLASVQSTPPAALETEWDPKAMYRSLARRLHPDRAAGEADRARRSRLMMRLNAAFAAEDRVQLELIAAELDRGDAPATEDDAAETEARMARRLAELAPVTERLERELRRVKSTAAYRRLEEAREARSKGVDYFEDAWRRTRAQARAARSRFAARAARIEEAARALSARFAGPRSAAAGAFAALEPPLLYRAAVTDVSVARDASGSFGTRLRGLARDAPWKAAWLIAAVFAEIAGRPPPGLLTLAAWEAWHESLRAGKRDVPSFDEALTDLPPALELGCRIHPEGVRFGVMLRDPEPGAFDPEAMRGAPCAAIAADVLLALAPRAVCPSCDVRVPLVHVHRLRDVDPLHALLCSRCGGVIEKYRAVGRLEGLEALVPYAVASGLVEELSVTFGGEEFRFDVLRRARGRLTAEGLARLFRETALGEEYDARPLSVIAARTALASGARVPRDRAITIAFRGAGPSERSAVAAMRLRCQKRFRRG